jgi:hypothetical protein
MPLLLHTWGNNAQCPLYRRLGEPQSQPLDYEEEKNPFPLPGIEPQFFGYLAHSLASVSTELPLVTYG